MLKKSILVTGLFFLLIAPALVSAQTIWCVVLTRNLGPNSEDATTGGEVTKLQMFLAMDAAIYPEGRITGFYGSLTTAAVQRYQARYGIISSGSPSTTGFGAIGPRTRAHMASLCTSGGSTSQVPGLSGSSLALSISSSPQQVSQTGTNLYWIVSQSGGIAPYQFAADWGDGQISPIQQSGTFYHTYSQAGSYAPAFAVRDGNNFIARVTAPAISIGGQSGGACTLTASGPSATGAMTLTWNAPNTTGGSIAPNVGNVGPSGSVFVTPTQTTTYQGTFYGSGTTVSCAVTVNVVPATQPITTNPSQGLFSTTSVVSISPALAPSTTTVQMHNNYFDPATVTVYPGSRVIWTNKGTLRHTATADDGSFSSGPLNPLQSYTHVFITPGTYRYYDQFYGAAGGQGMAGTIIVSGTASNTNTQATTTTAVKPSLIMSPLSGKAPLTITATVQNGMSCTPYTFAWGDGTNSDYPGPALGTNCVPKLQTGSLPHIYNNIGTYVALFTQSGYSPAPITINVFSATTTTTTGTTEPSISVSPTSGTKPLAVTLTINARSCTSFTLNWGDGSNDNYAGSSCTPAQTTLTRTHTYQNAGTYTIAFTQGTFASKTATVSVSNTSTGSTAPTCTLSASPATVSSGGNATLSWTSSNAASGTLSDGSSIGTSGSKTVSPTATTQYTATFTGTGGSVTCQATVTVSSQTSTGTIPTCSLTVSSSSIAKGKSVTVNWSSTNAIQVQSPSLGDIGLSGSKVVTPQVSTFYTASFFSSTGSSITCSATIQVVDPAAEITGLLCGARDLKCKPSPFATWGRKSGVSYGDEIGDVSQYSGLKVYSRTEDGYTFAWSPDFGVNVPCQGKEITVKACNPAVSFGIAGGPKPNIILTKDIVCPDGYAGVLLSSYVSDPGEPPTYALSSPTPEAPASLGVSGGTPATYTQLITCAKGWIPPKSPTDCSIYESTAAARIAGCL